MTCATGAFTSSDASVDASSGRDQKSNSPRINNVGVDIFGVSLIHASIERIQQRGVVTRPLKETTPQLESAIVWSSSTSHPALPKLLEVIREISF